MRWPQHPIRELHRWVCSRAPGSAALSALTLSTLALLSSSTHSQKSIEQVVIDTESHLISEQSGMSSTSAYLQRGASSLRGEGPDAYLTLEAVLSTPGYYQVLARWPQDRHAPAQTAVRYVVSADSRLEVERDQSSGAGLWQPLGMVTALTNHTVTLKVTGSGPGTVWADAFRFVYLGLQAPSLTVATTALELGTSGSHFHATLEAEHGEGELSWQALAPLPDGLHLDSVRGVIEGIPQDSGEFVLHFAVSDSAGHTAYTELLWAVLPPPNQRPPSLSSAHSSATSLLDRVTAMPEGSWLQVNENFFSDVWTPAELRPLKGRASNPEPFKIISAWSSFAWDSDNGDMFIYGGGHANYSGNDTYIWRSATGRWERSSLPSEVTQDDFGDFTAIDGVFAAPPSAHTYDNNVYLPIAQRFMIYGGAAYNNGGAFMYQTDPTSSRPTGPYDFDPLRADAMKVGGTTGSHVQRVAPHEYVIGGQMWQNRDLYGAPPAGTPLPNNFVMGTTAVTEENGFDVVYVNAKTGGSARQLFKHTIVDINDPSQDLWQQVGKYHAAYGKQGAGAYDPQRNIYLRAGNSFTYWDLANAGPDNRNVVFSPIDASGEFAPSSLYGMDHSPLTGDFYLWEGGTTVWRLHPPPLPSSGDWVIEQDALPASSGPAPGAGTGILGKWKFARDLNAFVALENAIEGNVWIYKPANWTPPAPGNIRPVISLDAPADGSIMELGSDITLQANARDPDGAVVAVEFFADGSSLGTVTAPPYQLTWTPLTAGVFSLSARATDNLGKVGTSVPITVSVESDNNPPVVAITSPTSGAAFELGDAVSIHTDASDPDDNLVRVEFYAGTTFLGEATATPWSFDWHDATEGDHDLIARAIDSESASSDSLPVPISVVDTNIPPVVVLNQPLDGEQFQTTDTVWFTADAADADGSIARVEFYVNGQWVGQADHMPYQYEWVNPPAGSYSVVARAVDDRGAVTDSTASSIAVTDSSGAIHLTLQQGRDGYMGARDTYLSSYHPSAALGGQNKLQEKSGRYTILLGFAIFQSEGGPVPDGAQIDSATLSLYKYTSYSHQYSLHALQAPWDELSTTWQERLPGTPWASPGAQQAGSDYATPGSAPGTAEWSPGWFSMDLTDNVDALSQGQANHGWLLVPLGGNNNTKRMYSRESTVDQSLRPKLDIVYRENDNDRPSVTLDAPLPGTSIDLGSSVHISATASDTDGTIQDVTFYADGIEIGQLTAAPYAFDWTPPGAGTIVLTAVARDDGGAATHSDPVTIQVVDNNLPPDITLSAPVSGSAFIEGDTITLAADATDPDGDVVEVVFYKGAVELGRVHSPPYQWEWHDAPLGSHLLSAKAVDDKGATSQSETALVNVTSASGSTLVVLQDGLDGYSGTRDNYLSDYHPNNSFGIQAKLQDKVGRYTMLVYFPIFHAEGGPIPDGAIIDSARLSLYKYSSYNHHYSIHPLLVEWDETASSWLDRKSGIPWLAPGAEGSDADYGAASIGQGWADWPAGWVDIDVSTGVQAIAAGTANHGWIWRSLGGNSNNKRYYSRNYETNPALRPKLKIEYRLP